MKICVLGCGLRTPLLLHGLIHSELDLTEIALYDTDPGRARLMAQLGSGLRKNDRVPTIGEAPSPEAAIEGSEFVISSIRVGNMETRARDERTALDCGFAGQETTGPAGFAMALRTIPVALEHARLVERLAPAAWLVSFTNPAGLITQALSAHSQARVVGICDTPAELIHQIAAALGERPEEVRCDYFGLNHLGWVRAVYVRGLNVIDRLLGDDESLRRLYPAELFPAPFLRALGLIPTEYLFYYYNQTLARNHQARSGATRGEELNVLNCRVLGELELWVSKGDLNSALETYRRYLNRRNASYMRLDGAGDSAFSGPDPDWDPFEGATGYHRIAVSVITALSGDTPESLILNVPNEGSILGLGPRDVVEVPCTVDRSGARPDTIGAVPEMVRGLMLSVKQYERIAIEAAIEGRWDLAALALTLNPIVGSWDAARQFLQRLGDKSSGEFAHFTERDILRSATR